MSLPVPQYPLLKRFDFILTQLRVVSLCAVKTPFGSDIRLYRWRKNNPEEDWKVSLANFSVRDIDLNELARRAIDMTKEFNVELRRGISAGGNTEMSSDDIDAVIERLMQRKRPSCPGCSAHETIPIAYGVFDPTLKNTAFGGTWITAECPLWQCPSCGREWGTVARMCDEQTS